MYQTFDAPSMKKEKVRKVKGVITFRV